VGLTAILGLLFWTLTGSPTSKMLAMCNARPGNSTEKEREARRLLENLAIGAGLPAPKLYVIDTPVPNAFAAGMDPAHAVVAVTNGLLGLLDQRELEGVLAHELSHIGNRDTRLNTIVAAIALFLRLPYLLRKKSREQRKFSAYQGGKSGWARASRYLLLPVYIYVFFIAPVLATLIRSAISRAREYLADADGALLTRNPEGLLRALAKIHGCGSVVSGSNPIVAHLYFADPLPAGLGIGLFTGGLLATHPPVDQRITRLAEFGGAVPPSVIEAAAREGAEYARNHPVMEGPREDAQPARDELSALSAGNPMGRVCRVLGPPTQLFDQPNPSTGVERIKVGDLLVVFDDPGKYRQVLTVDQTFGYIPRTVKLQRLDIVPAEVFDPELRKAFLAAHPVAETAAPKSAAPAAGATPGGLGLTSKQLAIAAVFAILVFGGMLLVMIKLTGN